VGLQQVSTMRCAVALAYYSVRMNLGLSVLQGDIG